MESRLPSLFNSFADLECQGSSALYEYLSRRIASDGELLEISCHARDGQPVPNLLFGSVQYLLLKGTVHPLKDYYPSLTDTPLEKEDSFQPFKDFCRTYRSEIIELLQTKLVQTNEIRRCGYLYPAFCHIYNLVKQPLALVEIGTSAGLQLYWDQYSYSCNDAAEIYGKKHSNVHIKTEIKGEGMPKLSREVPPVAYRVGLDLHVNDVGDSDDRLWLQALIWPEHVERRELYLQAAKALKGNDIRFIEGDGVALLPEIAREMPDDTALCVFHTHVANQIPKELKQKLLDHVSAIVKERNIFHIYNNFWDGRLHLDSVLDGEENSQIIGDTDGHGRWFRWEL